MTDETKKIKIGNLKSPQHDPLIKKEIIDFVINSGEKQSIARGKARKDMAKKYNIPEGTVSGWVSVAENKTAKRKQDRFCYSETKWDEIITYANNRGASKAARKYKVHVNTIYRKRSEKIRKRNTPPAKGNSIEVLEAMKKNRKQAELLEAEYKKLKDLL